MSAIIQHFQDFKLNKQLYTAIEEAGYTVPTPIQQRVIPLVLGGQDIIGIAQTGTGKTAAYLLPVLMKLKYAQGDTVRAIIFAPTKELAIQIDKQVEALGKYTDLRHVVLYGGIGPKTQIEEISKGVDIIVATPGRFMEIYLKGYIPTRQLQMLVLDEADRMMDMGFMPQLRQLLEVIPVKRQNLLFSATFAEKVERLSAEFLEFPTKVEVAPQATTVDTITQYVYSVPNMATKKSLLVHLLTQEGFDKVLVFVNSKQVAEEIQQVIYTQLRIPVKAIHSNKGQNMRINAMESFEDGSIRVLVATDVSARGIDIVGVSHVINVEVPAQHTEYIHRIGRTGRAQQAGISITMANKAERLHIDRIEKLTGVKIKIQSIPEEVRVEETSREELIEIEREIDRIKRRDNPDFKGAFHEKKNKHKIAQLKSKKAAAAAASGTKIKSKKAAAFKTAENPKSKSRKKY